MIVSFAHKGLERFFLTGSKSGIMVEHAARLQIILTRLHGAAAASDMNMPGFRLHALKGDMKTDWPVAVSGNWRVIFKFTREGVELVNYLDYH